MAFYLNIDRHRMGATIALAPNSLLQYTIELKIKVVRFNANFNYLSGTFGFLKPRFDQSFEGNSGNWFNAGAASLNVGQIVVVRYAIDRAAGTAQIFVYDENGGALLAQSPTSVMGNNQKNPLSSLVLANNGGPEPNNWNDFHLYYLKINSLCHYDMSDYIPGTNRVPDKLGISGDMIPAGTNYPVDNSQWVPYDDGSAAEQIQSISGALFTLQSGSAIATAINEQNLSVAGKIQAGQIATAITAVVNEQQKSASGSLLAQSTNTGSLLALNEQNLTISGAAVSVATGTAKLQSINELAGELASEQIGSISGQLFAASAGTAIAQRINEQQFNLSGTALLSSTADAVASAVNEQHLPLTGSAQASSYAFAALQGVNEQASEQIGNIGGQLIAVSVGHAVVNVINDQQRSISGTTIAASNGRARLQKINQGNIVLAPDRMSAKRITENLSATHIKQHITASRLIDNITVHRV